jgi:hypothetical protein
VDYVTSWLPWSSPSTTTPPTAPPTTPPPTDEPATGSVVGDAWRAYVDGVTRIWGSIGGAASQTVESAGNAAGAATTGFVVGQYAVGVLGLALLGGAYATRKTWAPMLGVKL